ncbi:unnamed protein product, partial [Onchocerca ochengi]|uniref:Uncharacterized protein n=1 Tax=Onchocerca ochengi TaxID=42157 RepID=A0A182ERG7_ONCOC
MLGSQSLSVFLNRATKSFRSSNRLEVSSKNNDHQKKTRTHHYSINNQQKQNLLRSLDTLSIWNLYGPHHIKVEPMVTIAMCLVGWAMEPRIRTDYSIIVADCGECDCSTFIHKLLKSTGKSITTDRQTNVISFRVDNLVKYLTLVEVNFEKVEIRHDLWSTLDFDGCMLLYSPKDLHSYKYAMKKLSQLKDLKEKYLLWLIGITSDPALPLTKSRIISYE